MAHACHHPFCDARVPTRMFLCRAHWKALPRVFQRAIWREYVPGQERSKTPSDAYLAVALRIVGDLAAQTPEHPRSAGVAAFYRRNAAEARERELSAGRSDPWRGFPALAA